MVSDWITTLTKFTGIGFAENAVESGAEKLFSSVKLYVFEDITYQKIKFPLKNQGEFSLTLKTTNMKSVD